MKRSARVFMAGSGSVLLMLIMISLSYGSANIESPLMPQGGKSFISEKAVQQGIIIISGTITRIAHKMVYVTDSKNRNIVFEVSDVTGLKVGDKIRFDERMLSSSLNTITKGDKSINVKGFRVIN
jgi:hypothetical protein